MLQLGDILFEVYESVINVVVSDLCVSRALNHPCLRLVSTIVIQFFCMLLGLLFLILIAFRNSSLNIHVCLCASIHLCLCASIFGMFTL